DRRAGPGAAAGCAGGQGAAVARARLMTPELTTYHFADIWDAVAARVPHRTALVADGERHTFAQLSDRVTRLAGWMWHAGVRQGDFVGLSLRNSSAFVEATLAAFSLRAVPVNVHYHLQPAELRHLLLDGPLVGVLHDPDVAQRLAAASVGCDALRWTLATGAPYEAALTQGAGIEVPRGPRPGDDPYVLYTGGTTGHPKGVVWQMQDAYFACLGGGDPFGDRGPVTRPADIVDRIGEPTVFLPVAPLVHAAGMWTTLRWLFAGSTVVLLPGFDPGAVWSAVMTEQVRVMNIVGDAMARPLLEAATDLTDPIPLRVLGSGGATLSSETKRRLLALFPELTIKDTFGSSETGVQGWSVHRAGDSVDARFELVSSLVLNANTLEPLAPGAPETGIVARTGHVPLRYHRDPVASARTFREVGDTRYALTGDEGRVEADGSVLVLGRGSQCINTGGEKVFAEEVEATMRAHHDVRDALVVGAPDKRWGQAVVALVEYVPGAVPDPEALRRFCRTHLAGFKVPKRVIGVPVIRRSPAGKPDYRWAASVAVASGQ
ncbi:MAG TPA: AMP-binding protein, partial [Aeromicrobium sp.]|nr:AMP-binding protein [Aeromicrobium sp.]